MELPACIYGYYRDVKRECDKVVRKIKKGALIEEAVGNEMFDTKTIPCYIITEGPSPLTGGEQHFNLFALLYRYLAQERDEEKREQFFYNALNFSWSTLLLLTGNCGLGQELHIPPERHKPFLQAVIKYYAYFDAAGSVYSYGTRQGKRIWDINTNIKFVLARRRVPNDVLSAPLPAGGIEELINIYNLLA